MTSLFGFLFLLGLFVGSFLGVLIERIPKKEDFIKDRSKCASCRHILAWYDLVPVFSFLFLLRKCRYCKAELSYFYPFIEILTALLFVFTAWKLTGTYVDLVYFLFIMSSFIVIFFTDLKQRMIPNIVVYPAIFVSIGYLILNTNYLIPNVLAAIGVFLFFLFLFVITRGKGMGFGDVQFSILLGLFLGYPNIVFAVYIAFLTGAAISLILIMGKRYTIKSAIPFGPFLIIGALCMFFFGEKAITLFPYL